MGGGSKQTTTSNSEPWKGAQPTLTKGLGIANEVADNSSLWQPHTGSTVVPWSSDSTEGKRVLGAYAKNNMYSDGMSGQLQNIINRGGYTEPQMDALNNFRQTANSEFNINEDPAFQQVFNKTADGVNLMASAAGRYGSPGAHQGTLARELGDLGARQYQNWQSRRDAANTNLFNMGQQGQSNLTNAFQGMQLPALTLLQAGAMDDDLATRQMNDQLRIYNETQNMPKQRAEWLNAIGSGAGSLGGTTRQTQPGQNPFLTALGYGASGLGLLGGFM